MKENNLFEKFRGFIEDHGPPHEMHADIVVKGGYPTHTHGLEAFGLPELFINATAFGPQANGHTINDVVFYMTKHRAVYDRIATGRYTELILWGEKYPTLCIRRVDKEFAGVEVAYNLLINPEEESKTGYAQIFVKGDAHALEDSYYTSSERGDPVLQCSACEGEL
jgi:hypothetical protein